jgi:UPF0716 family protein affecting phage T7 exclusion
MNARRILWSVLVEILMCMVTLAVIGVLYLLVLIIAFHLQNV